MENGTRNGRNEKVFAEMGLKRNHFFEPVRSEKTEFEKKDILLFREFAFLLL